MGAGALRGAVTVRYAPMRRLPVLLLALAFAACGNVTNPATDGGTDGSVDSQETGRCDPTKPFGAPTLVEGLSSASSEVALGITRDEKIAFVTRVQGSPPVSTILVAERGSATEPFGTPSMLLTGDLNGATGNEYSGAPSGDGLLLYFHRQIEAGPQAGIGTLVAARATTQAPFNGGEGVLVDGGGLENTLSPALSSDGQTLYWLDFNDFGRVFRATRGGTPSSFSNADVIATMAISTTPVLSADELTLYYATGNGDDVLVTTRASKAAMFTPGAAVPGVNSAMQDYPVALSHDGCVLYLASTRAGGPGGTDLWQARRPQ